MNLMMTRMRRMTLTSNQREVKNQRNASNSKGMLETPPSSSHRNSESYSNIWNLFTRTWYCKHVASASPVKISTATSITDRKSQKHNKQSAAQDQCRMVFVAKLLFMDKIFVSG